MLRAVLFKVSGELVLLPNFSQSQLSYKSRSKMNQNTKVDMTFRLELFVG